MTLHAYLIDTYAYCDNEFIYKCSDPVGQAVKMVDDPMLSDHQIMIEPVVGKSWMRGDIVIPIMSCSSDNSLIVLCNYIKTIHDIPYTIIPYLTIYGQSYWIILHKTMRRKQAVALLSSFPRCGDRLNNLRITHERVFIQGTPPKPPLDFNQLARVMDHSIQEMRHGVIPSFPDKIDTGIAAIDEWYIEFTEYWNAVFNMLRIRRNT